MTKRIQTKRYWYFVTQDGMGDKMQLCPRVPRSMGADEPQIKRICVAPTAAHCLSAIGISFREPIYVYRTVRRVNATKAWDVGDSDITHEHFLLRKSWFELIAVLSPDWTYAQYENGAFEDRGYSKDSHSSKWELQKLQRNRLIKSAVKFDRRFGIISESDDKFSFDGIGKVFGPKWDRMALDLSLAGIKVDDPAPASNPVDELKPWFNPIQNKPTKNVLDVCLE